MYFSHQHYLPFVVPTIMTSDISDSDISLLAACKNKDENEILRLIANRTIFKDELNAVDSNGRTALSYICATSNIKVLRLLLRLPNIDINKADNEGNTPLHFAAEAGKSNVISSLCSRQHLKTLNIDAKNRFGLTPLMKACIKGRLLCAKRLIFANASLIEIDNRRGLTAENWARLCGHQHFANTISRMKNRGKESMLSRIAYLFAIGRVELGSKIIKPAICYSSIEATIDFKETSIPTIEITPPTPCSDKDLRIFKF